MARKRAIVVRVLVLFAIFDIANNVGNNLAGTKFTGNKFTGNKVAAQDWPQFRGPDAAGIASGQDLPDTWDVKTGENIRWQVSIPGLGHACPVVSRGRVFIVTADNGEADPELRLGLYGDIGSVKDDKPHEWKLLCFSLATGDLLWQRTLHRGVPAIKRHTKATHANTTPAADGEHLVVFLGSEGLYCYDYQGRELWKRDLGVLDSGYFAVPSAQWGFASSPIIHQGTVYLQCDVQKDSFLAAYDVSDGRPLWKTARDDVPTWSTPAIVQGPTRTELVVNGFKHAGGYDPATGKPLWKLGGGGDIPVPTPIYAHGLIYLSSAHGFFRPLSAVRPGLSGDITPKAGKPDAAAMAWFEPRGGIYMQTPLVFGDYLYACRNNGVLSCYDAQTGDRKYQQRLGRGNSGFTASAVAADGCVYFTSEEGVVHIIEAGPEFKQIGTVELGESCMATPAISDGVLLFRTQHQLIAVGRPLREPVIANVTSTRRLLRPQRWRNVFSRRCRRK